MKTTANQKPKLVKFIVISLSAITLTIGLSNSYSYSKECFELREHVCKFGGIDQLRRACANVVGGAGAIGGGAGGASIGCLIGGAVGALIGSGAAVAGPIGVVSAVPQAAAVGCALGGGAGGAAGLIGGGVGLSQICNLYKTRYDRCVNQEKFRFICLDLNRTM